MRVTIIADASYCATHRVAGYGYWIACERGKMPGGGHMRDKVDSSTDAEMMAIVNALHDGLKHNLIQKGDEVLVQTDCMGAIELLREAWFPTVVDPKPGRKKRSVIAVFRDLQDRANLTITFRHVKGHTTDAAPRYAANRACDQRARAAMRARRKQEQG